MCFFFGKQNIYLKKSCLSFKNFYLIDLFLRGKNNSLTIPLFNLQLFS